MRDAFAEATAARPVLAIPRHPSSTAHVLERMLLFAQCTSLLAITSLVATRSWQHHEWLGWSLAIATLALWLPELARPRARRLWFLYVAGIFAYTLLRSYADDTGIPVRTDYVIEAERWVFLGSVPAVWLQQRFFTPAELSWLDWFAVQVHWSFFIVPHAAAVLIFMFRREYFARYAFVVVATMYVGLLLFYLVPTTPPWLASSVGVLPHAWRVMDFVGSNVDASTYNALYQSLGEPNSVAAMPSIHMAVTFALYLWAREHAPRLAPWLLGYTAAMGFALVYLAEHYVVDLLIGMLCAYGCHLLGRRALPLRTAPAPASEGHPAS